MPENIQAINTVLLTIATLGVGVAVTYLVSISKRLRILDAFAQWRDDFIKWCDKQHENVDDRIRKLEKDK